MADGFTSAVECGCIPGVRLNKATPRLWPAEGAGET